MRSGGGKGKGSAFERLVCHRLSLWLSRGERDDLLWRSAMSGGRATLQLATGKVNLAQSGDVTAISHQAYAFCESHFIECKFYQDLQIDRGLLCGTGYLLAFWNVVRKEARRYQKRPVLIAKQNHYPILVLVDRDNDIFGISYLLDVPHLNARVYLFDNATKVRKPLRRRMQRGN